MPCIRGVEVSLIQGIDPGQPRDPLNPNNNDRQFPEFPHPDSSSIRLSPRPDASQNNDTLADGSHIRKTNSRVSVYVPSEQGLRFAFEWHIKRPEEHPYFVYFVVLFNGRRMVSWGADPSKVDRGITEYALYEQGNKKTFPDSTAAATNHGMEKRYFYFFSEDDAQLASDGGLIEVQAFRAKGRRLRVATPPEYRGQENYGIMCPSGGMVESARDLSYYDWHLHDRIDDPFTTFRFYYRSLANLKYLSIVPQSYRMPEVSTTSSLYFEDAAYHAGEARDPGPVEYPDIISQYIFGSPTRGDKERKALENAATPSFQPHPKLSPTRPAKTQPLPQPSKSARDASSDEGPEWPLPMLPESFSQSSSTSSLGRVSSVRSRASTGASVTPSLWDYVDDLSTDLEDAEICDARAISVQRVDYGLARVEATVAAMDFPVRVDSIRWDVMGRPNTSKDETTRSPPRSASSSDYEASPPPSESSKVFAPPEQAEICRHPSQTQGGGSSLGTSDPDCGKLGSMPNVIPVFIPEGQWIRSVTGRRTPSPLRRRQTQTGLNLLAADREIPHREQEETFEACGLTSTSNVETLDGRVQVACSSSPTKSTE